MVFQDQQLVGAMRVAFERYTQRFYASYFVTAPSKRNRTTGVLLVGGMLRIMEENNIQTLYADSHQHILKEYLNFGCKIIGKPYKKYGFSCEWTPIRYQLSECTSAGNWMRERAYPFLSSQQCQWKFPVKLILCETIEEYQNSLERLIQTRQVFSTFPVLQTEESSSHWNKLKLTAVESIQTQSAQTWIETQSDSINHCSFSQINSLVSRRRILVVKQNSSLLPMAQCYAVLTGKYLQVVDDLSQLQINQETESVGIWITQQELSHAEWDILTQQSYKVGLGLQIYQTAADCSTHLLQNYLSFIQPQIHPLIFSSENCAVLSLEWSRNYRQFASFGESHYIMCKVEIPLGLKAQNFCQELLENGFSFGDAIKRMNLEFSSPVCSQPFLLIGDPATHIIGKQSIAKILSLTN